MKNNKGQDKPTKNNNWNKGQGMPVKPPSILPFGGSDDAVHLTTADGRRVCWQISDDLFLRVNIWKPGSDVVYLILNRKEMQNDCLEFLGVYEKGQPSVPVVLGGSGMDGLKEFRFHLVIKTIKESIK